MDYASESKRLHEIWNGKIEVISRVKVDSKDDLSVAYTPGVARPCLEIQKNPSLSYDLTGRHNLVAVITDGTAVLGLGDIGPLAALRRFQGSGGILQDSCPDRRQLRRYQPRGYLRTALL